MLQFPYELYTFEPTLCCWQVPVCVLCIGVFWLHMSIANFLTNCALSINCGCPGMWWGAVLWWGTAGGQGRGALMQTSLPGMHAVSCLSVHQTSWWVGF